MTTFNITQARLILNAEFKSVLPGLFRGGWENVGYELLGKLEGMSVAPIDIKPLGQGMHLADHGVVCFLSRLDAQLHLSPGRITVSSTAPRPRRLPELVDVLSAALSLDGCSSQVASCGFTLELTGSLEQSTLSDFLSQFVTVMPSRSERTYPQALALSYEQNDDYLFSWAGFGHQLLCRMDYRFKRDTLRLIADRGNSLVVDATFFVTPSWNGPNFVGFSGCLDRIRFAVDPSQSMFYFGIA